MQQIVRVFWDTQLATFLWHIAARAHLERQTHNRVYQRVSRIWAGAAALPGNNATRGNKSIDIELTTTRRPTGQLGNCQTAAAANAKDLTSTALPAFVVPAASAPIPSSVLFLLPLVACYVLGSFIK